MTASRSKISTTLAAVLATATVAVAQPPHQAVSFPDLQDIVLEDLAATLTNPLFSASRQMPVPEPPTPEPEPAVVVAEPPIPEPLDPPRVTLVGIVIARGAKVAILRDEETGAIHRVQSGEIFDGWTFTVTDPHTIAIANDGESMVRTLFERAAPLSQAQPEPEPLEQASVGPWR